MSAIETAIDGRNGTAASARRDETARDLVDLSAVPEVAWTLLAERALEPNAYYDPLWARAASRHARDRQDAKALLAWDRNGRLIGLLPVVSAWRALALPIPALVAWQGYSPLTTPLLDRDAPEAAMRGLIDAAYSAGAEALLLPHLPESGPVADVVRRVLAERRLAPRMLRRRERAWLDAAQPAEEMLQAALGGKKLKELRRQRNRLADDGEVTFTVASKPDAVASALEDFLALEANGWKGARGTALLQHAGDAAFIRQAAVALAGQNRCKIVTLARAGVPVAVGVILRHARRAYFFKFAYDEREAKTSPGVQLTLDLTRYFCAHAGIDGVDSTADSDHPMIDRIWRDRMAIAEFLIPTGTGASLLAPIGLLIAARNAARECAGRIVRKIRA